ncbi:MAG: BlaI/MecI/CopY family transcriptional regulator, partial [Deltaproteobacteria bacterium]|nr:BlaI/MecI/CopY family transcriptional regulator [Deltaproteobacteria bacterium]
TTRKEGRSHVYVPAEEKPRYEARSVRHMLGALFGGDRVALLRQLIDSEPVAADELAELQSLLDDKLGREQ